MSSVELTTDQGVACIRLNRPERLNAGSEDLLQSLLKLLYHCEADSDIKAIHLTGEGRAFSAGFDLKDVPRDRNEDGLHEYFRWMAMIWHEVLLELVRIPKPVVAAVNGMAIGGGLGMVLASDLALAAESATFLMSYHSIGLTPDATTTYHLPRSIGIRRAMELAYTNRTLSASEAAEWGLINRVVPDVELQAQSLALARDLARGPTPIIGRTKQLFHGSWTESLETQAEMEKQSVMWAVRQPWFRNALDEFADKRGRPAARPTIADSEIQSK